MNLKLLVSLRCEGIKMTQRHHREPPSGGFLFFLPMQLTIKFEQFNLTDRNKSLVGETLVNKKINGAVAQLVRASRVQVSATLQKAKS